MKLLLSAAAVLVAAAVLAAAAAGAPQASLPDIEDEVMCPTCGLPLAHSFSPQAERQREFILTQIEAGRDKEQIKQALVAEFGSEVLAEPDPGESGFDIAAFLVPAAVVVGGLVAIWVARRAMAPPRAWRRQAGGGAERSRLRAPRAGPLALRPVGRAVLVIADSTPSIGLAFAAGLASFLSPCVLPLVPGYLSTVCGLTPGELRATRGAQLRGVVARSGLFILTFSAIFILLGMTATGIGSTLVRQPARRSRRSRASRSSRWASCSCWRWSSRC